MRVGSELKTYGSLSGLLFAGILVAALWLAPGLAYGQSLELRSASSRFSILYSQGRYEEALPFANKAVRLAEEEFGDSHPVLAKRLHDLAVLRSKQGHFSEAESMNERALAFWQAMDFQVEGVRMSLEPMADASDTKTAHTTVMLRDEQRA